jgi:hypothetical protein
MGADGEEALADREIAVAKRALDDGLVRQLRLQLAPDLDTLEQPAAFVKARQAERERCVHMEVAIDEGRRDKLAMRVDGVDGIALEIGRDRRDAIGCDADTMPVLPSGSDALMILRSNIVSVFVP